VWRPCVTCTRTCTAAAGRSSHAHRYPSRSMMPPRRSAPAGGGLRCVPAAATRARPAPAASAASRRRAAQARHAAHPAWAARWRRAGAVGGRGRRAAGTRAPPRAPPCAHARRRAPGRAAPATDSPAAPDACCDTHTRARARAHSRKTVRRRRGVACSSPPARLRPLFGLLACPRAASTPLRLVPPAPLAAVPSRHLSPGRRLPAHRGRAHVHIRGLPAFPRGATLRLAVGRWKSHR
jgi:hypothetical protein